MNLLVYQEVIEHLQPILKFICVRDLNHLPCLARRGPASSYTGSSAIINSCVSNSTANMSIFILLCTLGVSLAAAAEASSTGAAMVGMARRQRISHLVKSYQYNDYQIFSLEVSS